MVQWYFPPLVFPVMPSNQKVNKNEDLTYLLLNIVEMAL